MSLRELKESQRGSRGDDFSNNGRHYTGTSSGASVSSTSSQKWNSTKSESGSLGSNLRAHSKSPTVDTSSDPIANAMAKKRTGMVSRSSRDNLSGSDHGVSRITASGAWIDPLSTSDHGRRTGDWMEMDTSGFSNSSNHSKASLDWSNHSEGSHDRVLAKRYADANKLDTKSRFTSESQSNFKSHKTTPSGRKIKL